LFTVHRPDGRTATIFRPDATDPERPGHKYEAEVKRLGGAGNVLDVHPSLRHLIGDAHVPVIFVEGIKKADAIISAARAAGIDLVVAAVSGTWNWKTDGEPILDMFDIPVEGRRTLIVYDSDMLRKPGVQHAAEELALHLTRRGAGVEVVYLSDQPDGSKTGADDFLAGGGTLAGLLALARPFDPESVQREKLSRNEKLRRVLAYLTRRVEGMPAKGQRDCSIRAAGRAFVAHARRHGNLVGDDIEIERLSARSGAEMAAMSQPTFSKCVAALEERDFLRRGKRETKEQATPYVLLGGLFRYQDGEGERRTGDNDGKGGSGDREREVSLGDNAVTPLPEMRWSVPGRKPRRGVAKGTRKVRQGRSLSGDVPAKRRPGKKRGEITRYLAENGGEATRAELLERFGGEKTTWRNFKKQTLADLLGRRRSYKGQPLEIGPPVIALTEDGIRFVEGWEPEAADEQRRDNMMARIAWRRRNETKGDPGPTEEEMAEDREGREKRRRVSRLVYEGMSRRLATEEVLGANGFVEELARVEEEVHPLACGCLDCSATMPRYVRLAVASLGRGA
jgi:hypothetical protein